MAMCFSLIRKRVALLLVQSAGMNGGEENVPECIRCEIGIHRRTF